MQEAGLYPKPFEELAKEEMQYVLYFNELRVTATTPLTEAGCSI